MTSKFALVIANTEYQDTSFAKLTAPGKDAEEFGQVLRDPEIAAFDDVQVLINEGEGRTRRAIAHFFGDRKPADLLLLYFSGHGVRNEQGQLFLAAIDTEINILEATGIPAEFITGAMNNSRSQRQLLILDCCNSGAFAQGTKSASAVGKSMGIAGAFEGDGYGRVVLTATDATQFAWEGDKLIGNTQTSVFTHFLIEGLKGEADRDGDGRIKVDELYDYAYEQVINITPKQTPGKWSYKQQGDMILRENLKLHDVKPAPLPPELLELLSHPNSGVRKAGVQDLITLLDGRHMGLARAAEEKLREMAANDDSITLRRGVSDTLIAHGLSLSQPAPPPIETPPITEKKFASLPSLGSLETIPWRLVGLVTGGLLVIGFLIWGATKFLGNPPTITPDTTLTIPSNLTVAPQPSKTVTVRPTRTKTPVLTPTSAFHIGSTMTGQDGMTLFYVPAGNFMMGYKAQDALTQCQEFRSDCQLDWFKGEEPLHTVFLDAYWIDKTEVTNTMYAKCVNDGRCNPPIASSSLTRDSYYRNSEFVNYPVIYVTWDDAKAYCEWADRRLPTEAEWEKAARGENAFVYPWGNDFDATRLNFCDKNCTLNWADKSPDDGYADTAPVGSYPDGASPYGALDMAGNVWEWVMDRYNATYYATVGENARNPQGPGSGQYRVLRGGALGANDAFVRTAVRFWREPTTSNYSFGFRCAMSTAP